MRTDNHARLIAFIRRERRVVFRRGASEWLLDTLDKILEYAKKQKQGNYGSKKTSD